MAWDAEKGCMDAGPSPEEKLCVGTGGKWDNGKCDCGPDMAWDAEKGCMDAGPSPEEKLCAETGGMWMNNMCMCGPGMSWDPKQGCVKDTPIEGACLNEKDSALYKDTPNKDLNDVLLACIMANFGASGAELGACLAQTIPFSKDCAVCFGNNIKCFMEMCSNVCGEDGNEKDCLDCQAKNCTPTFEMCSGLTPNDGGDGDDPEALCVNTGGKWLKDTCGNWECGQEPMCNAIIPGCDCGKTGKFDPESGCFESAECGGGDPGDQAKLVINEVAYDQPGSDTNEFVELYNPTENPVDLTGVTFVLVNGSSNTIYEEVALSAAGTIKPGGFLLIVERLRSQAA